DVPAQRPHRAVQAGRDVRTPSHPQAQAPDASGRNRQMGGESARAGLLHRPARALLQERAGKSEAGLGARQKTRRSPRDDQGAGDQTRDGSREGVLNLDKTPDKKARLLASLERGMTMIHLDARKPGVLVPEHLKKEAHLLLNLSYRFSPHDLTVSEWGMRET